MGKDKDKNGKEIDFEEFKSKVFQHLQRMDKRLTADEKDFGNKIYRLEEDVAQIKCSHSNKKFSVERMADKKDGRHHGGVCHSIITVCDASTTEIKNNVFKNYYSPFKPILKTDENCRFTVTCQDCGKVLKVYKYSQKSEFLRAQIDYLTTQKDGQYEDANILIKQLIREKSEIDKK